MSTSITVRRYLNRQDVRYATVTCPGEQDDIIRNGTKAMPPSHIAKAVILKDLRGMLLAVIPGSHDLDIDILNRQLHRNLQIADPGDYLGIFSDCAPGITPPLGEAYGFETIIDDGLLNKEVIYFVSGNPNEMIRISGHDFQLLHSNAWYGNTFSRIVKDDDSVTSDKTKTRAPSVVTPSVDMRQQIEKLTNLPPMPTMAQKIIQLNTNPYAHAEDLAKLVENDPALSAQIIRYAQSPFYGYRGNVASIRQAISRVLGYDMVMNIALGIAATRPFKNAPHGPLGLNAFWRHATYCATLSKGLCDAMPAKIRPRGGTAYLSGLLHNFGILLLGYLFPKEFTLLNNAVTENPSTPITELEMNLLGSSHTEIGAWLMEAWHMPPEIITCISEHHNPGFTGPHAEYAQLVMLANILLKSHNIGDASDATLPEDLLETLGISEEQAISILEKTIQVRDDLENMARQLAA